SPSSTWKSSPRVHGPTAFGVARAAATVASPPASGRQGGGFQALALGPEPGRGRIVLGGAARRVGLALVEVESAHRRDLGRGRQIDDRLGPFLGADRAE